MASRSPTCVTARKAPRPTRSARRGRTLYGHCSSATLARPKANGAKLTTTKTAGTRDAAFWERLALPKKIGALWYEPWVFDGEELDAEPLIPIDPAVFYNFDAGDDEARLTKLALETCRVLLTGRDYMYEGREFDVLVPLTVPRKPPALRKVARLRVEADTPGHRLAYKKRRVLIEQHLAGFAQTMEDAAIERFDRPMRTGPAKAAS